MSQTLQLLYDYVQLKDVIIDKKDEYIMSKISDILANQKVQYGHFELHGDNIIVDKDNIYFVDFEKFHPHIQHIDLISLLMNENIDSKKIKYYIDYYIQINKIADKNIFLYVLDCANVYYNLKIINMIIRNLLGCETKWTEIGGNKIKIIEKTDSNYGINWNEERNEKIETRINNILNFNFSKNDELIKLKNNLFSRVMSKIEQER